jgi:hypothetical protein
MFVVIHFSPQVCFLLVNLIHKIANKYTFGNILAILIQLKLL